MCVFKVKLVTFGEPIFISILWLFEILYLNKFDFLTFSSVYAYMDVHVQFAYMPAFLQEKANVHLSFAVNSVDK